jgi:hypothetical protein
MNLSEYSKEIYNRYGVVTRAKNCFLYTKKGIRLTDLFLENGRAILGWQGGAAFTYFKNNLSRGITGSYITEDYPRVQKATGELLDGPQKNNTRTRQIFYFSSRASAIKAALLFSSENTSFYRPWSPEKINWQDVDCVVLATPLPWTDNLFILAVKTSVSAVQTPADSEKIPFPLESAVARSIYDLIEAQKIREEKDWFIYDPVLTKYWTRKGPYLYPKIPAEKYNDFVLHCLDCGICINPDYNSPSIVPYGADKGVFSKLKNSPFPF